MAANSFSVDLQIEQAKDTLLELLVLFWLVWTLLDVLVLYNVGEQIQREKLTSLPTQCGN